MPGSPSCQARRITASSSLRRWLPPSRRSWRRHDEVGRNDDRGSVPTETSHPRRVARTEGGIDVTENYANLPRVVSRDEWLAARKDLLAREKKFTKQRDAMNAERRKLPMVRIEKEHVFEGPEGKASLLDLFEGRRQLIVGHFMFDPSWEEGCPSCSAGADEISDGLLRHLHVRLRLTCAAGQDRVLQGEQGLDLPLVLLLRQRLQLRLPRNVGRIRCTRRVQLPNHGRPGRAASRGTRPEFFPAGGR